MPADGPRVLSLVGRLRLAVDLGQEMGTLTMDSSTSSVSCLILTLLSLPLLTGSLLVTFSPHPLSMLGFVVHPQESTLRPPVGD